jgi:hypothetical protein
MLQLTKYTDGSLNLIEIGQVQAIRMAFVSKEGDDSYVQLHSSVLCKDFFNEVLVENYKPNSVLPFPEKKHGFSYDVANYPLDKDATRLMLTGPKSQIENIKAHLYLLEEEVNICNDTDVRIVGDIEGGIIVEADAFWQSYTIYISLLTLLLRLLSYNGTGSTLQDFVEENIYGQDRDAWNDITKHVTVSWMVNNASLITDGVDNPAGVDIYDSDAVHHNSGIVASFGEGVFTSPKNKFAENIRAFLTKGCKIFFIDDSWTRFFPGEYICNHTLQGRFRVMNIEDYRVFTKHSESRWRCLYGKIMLVRDGELERFADWSNPELYEEVQEGNIYYLNYIGPTSNV